jgi:hypothetical protein
MIPFEEIKKRYRDLRIHFRWWSDGVVFEFGFWDVSFIEREDLEIMYRIARPKPLFINNIHPKCGLGVDIAFVVSRVYGNRYSSIDEYLRSRQRRFREHLRHLDRLWEGGKIILEKKVFNDFKEFYDAFELYFKKWGYPAEFIPNSRGGLDFCLLQGLPVWVMEMYSPDDKWVGRMLLPQIDNWYHYLWLSWDESYKNLCPGTYGIWSVLKQFIIGKDAVFDGAEVGYVDPSGQAKFDNYQVILRTPVYIYKAKFGVVSALGICLDKDGVMSVPNANKITENEYFKFLD